MTDKRLIVAVLPLALLAACNEEATDDGRAASGEVLEGTISDAMLPVDRLTSEPPLEDPEAFAAAQERAADSPVGAATPAEGEAPDAEAPEPGAAPAVPPPEPAD